jgi:hypothetical protein
MVIFLAVRKTLLRAGRLVFVCADFEQELFLLDRRAIDEARRNLFAIWSIAVSPFIKDLLFTCLQWSERYRYGGTPASAAPGGAHQRNQRLGNRAHGAKLINAEERGAALAVDWPLPLARRRATQWFLRQPKRPAVAGRNTHAPLALQTTRREAILAVVIFHHRSFSTPN